MPTLPMERDVLSVKPLVDSYGRTIRKLRVSLLDACNFRCFYCMPAKMSFMNPDLLLTPKEIEHICSSLIARGLEQVRITGGEPTIRQEFRDIVTRLSGLPLAKLAMTTNGLKLEKELDFLWDSRCRHINISLDSLNEDKFAKITRRRCFDSVYSAILRTKKMGFNTKINVVLMRGINDDEIFDFVKFSSEFDIEVRFLEVMKIGQACGSQDQIFMSAAEAIGQLNQKVFLQKVAVDYDSTSFNFETPAGAKIGFIASESMPFCGTCSRWRLSADGFLRACLMSNKGASVRSLPHSEWDQVLESVLSMKPITRIERVADHMNQIGG